MQEHYWENAAAYEAQVSKGFMTLRPSNFSVPSKEKMRYFRDAIDDKQNIRSMLFNGFKCCLYPVQRFHSDSERQFAIILEDEQDDLKWFKPAEGHFKIHYAHNKNAYEPDFVVETATAKYLCEPKRASEMDDPEVLAKAKAAVAWCNHATEHELAHGGKSWSYLLIPHDEISANKTLQGLTAAYTRNED